MTQSQIPVVLLSRRGFIAASGATLAALSLPRTARAKDAGVLTYGLSAYPPGLDPLRHEGEAADVVKLQLFRGLLGLDSKDEVVPELAHKWEQKDQTVFTFHLRPGAVFQNGDPVTAADVKWSLEQITAKGSTAFLLSELKMLSKIEAVDEQTVKITLDSPTPAFVRLLASPYAPVLSAKAGMDQPVGAGPYRISKKERGVSIEFEAFDKYYKPGLPKTKHMKMVVYSDESLRVSALQSGDVDIIEYVPWQDMGEIESNKALVLEQRYGIFMDIVFNVSQPPFNDPKVRQAVAFAVNRDDVIKAAFYGRGKPLNGLPIPATSPFADATTEKLWSYDPAKAESLLKEAGAAGKQVTLLSTSTYSMHQATAEVVQQNLMAVGLQVKLQLPEWGARVAQGNQGQYQFAINGAVLPINDPDGLTNLIGGGPASYQRPFGYSNQKLNALLAKGRHEVDDAKRKAEYDAVAEIVKTDVPICFLNWRSQGWAYQRKTVKGFEAIPGSDCLYSGYVLEDIELV